MRDLEPFGLLALCALATACTPGPRATLPAFPQAAVAATWTPQTPFPPPEGDLAYIRSYYAATFHQTFSPEQERIALLQMFIYRAQRQRFPGYVQVWGDEGRFRVNMKRPYAWQATLALASPELRPLLIANEVTHTLAEIDRLQKQLIGFLETFKGGDWGLSHNYRNDRFDIAIVGEDNAAALRKMLTPELGQMTDISVVEGPVNVLVGQQQH
ncbi:MAG: hypothetical protein RLZZ366_784 [Pseudomonadota bacterium]|jgi:hypothetical protein